MPGAVPGFVERVVSSGTGIALVVSATTAPLVALFRFKKRKSTSR